MPVVNNVCVYICRPDALKGSLVDTLRKCRPTLSVAVPRLYEKMAENIKKKHDEAGVRVSEVSHAVAAAEDHGLGHGHRLPRLHDTRVRKDVHASVLLRTGEEHCLRQDEGDAGTRQVTARRDGDA